MSGGVTFLDPGLLDRRAVLEEDRGSADAMGGRSVAWREVAELSAHLQPLAVGLQDRFERLAGRPTHQVTLRHRADLRLGMALRFGTRRLVVREMADPDGRRRYLVCRCEEAA